MTGRKHQKHVMSKKYLPASPTHDNIFGILGVSLDLNLLPTAWSVHGEAPYLGAVVIAYLLLISIESHAFAYQVVTSSTPDIEWHLESDDQDAFIELAGSLPEWVLSSKLQSQIASLVNSIEYVG